MAADLSPVGLRKVRLLAEAQLLAVRYGEVKFDEQHAAWVLVRRFPLPPGWSKPEVSILIDIPSGNPGYPVTAPSHFWTLRNLSTADGRPIEHFFTASGYMANPRYLERGWGHFCIYIKKWRPAAGARMLEGHTLVSYLDLIATIFRDRKRLAGDPYYEY